MTAPSCSRCDSGWFQHPSQGWAVACPNCRPEADRDVFWLPSFTGTGDGRVVRRHQLPADHPSQREVAAPDYVRVAVADMAARNRARQLVLEADHRRSA